MRLLLATMALLLLTAAAVPVASAAAPCRQVCVWSGGADHCAGNAAVGDAGGPTVGVACDDDHDGSVDCLIAAWLRPEPRSCTVASGSAPSGPIPVCFTNQFCVVAGGFCVAAAAAGDAGGPTVAAVCGDGCVLAAWLRPDPRQCLVSGN